MPATPRKTWTACLSGRLVGLPVGQSIADTFDPVKRTKLLQSLGCLVKTRDDLEIAKALMLGRLSQAG